MDIMRIFNGLEELKAAVGTVVGVSDWIEITQDRIDKFADATCDEQWIHVDQDRAKQEMPGGKTIAHGLLSLSLTPMFIRSVMGLKGLKNTLNYGATASAISHPCQQAQSCAETSALLKPRMCRRTDCASTTA
jgi:acyl dehydratase